MRSERRRLRGPSLVVMALMIGVCSDARAQADPWAPFGAGANYGAQPQPAPPQYIINGNMYTDVASALYAVNSGVAQALSNSETALIGAQGARSLVDRTITGLEGVAASFGGGADYNSASGYFRAPTYYVGGGQALGSVGAAVTALDARATLGITNAAAAQNLAQQADHNAGVAFDKANNASYQASQAQITAAAAQSTADTAVTKADTAQGTANTAKTTADAALGTATTAQSTADAAQQTANTAVSKADTAQGTANSAVTAAGNAQSTANTAVTKADAAQSTANTARTEAGGAQTTANTAVIAASDAQSLAGAAMTNAAAAQHAADVAQGTANTANTKADAAQSTANTARTEAGAAQSTANTAVTKADTAQTTANTAQGTANTAITKADAAQSTANTARTEAGAAQSTANTAVTKADAAQVAANAAQSTADLALGNAATAQNTADTARNEAAAAQSTANTAVQKADAAQATADSARTEAAAAQTTANTARTEAAAAQSTADTARVEAATAQGTADTARTEAAAAQSTANTAVTKADAAQQSADAAQVTANTAVAGAALAQSTATLAVVKADAAQGTANTARAEAATAQATANSANSGVSQVATALGGGSSFDASTGTLTKPTYAVAGGSYDNVGSALSAVSDQAATAQSTADTAIARGNAGGAATAAALGGGATYDAATGAITAPTYVVNGQSFNNVGGALGAVDANLGSINYQLTQIIQAGAGIKYIRFNSTGADASATGENAVAIGTGAVAAGSNSIAMGTGSEATGANAIAIGTGNKVSGNNSGAIGDPNIVTGNASYAIGNDNTIAANKAFALGNNITIASGLDGSVVLGDSSAAKAATSVTGAVVNNVAYSGFAGSTPGSTVSVGAAGAERQVTNVAAGQISATSTDAVNGSQIYIVASTLTANTNTVGTGAAAAIGGGAKYDTATQAWTGPNYQLPGITGQYTDVVSGLQVTAAVAAAAATGQLGPVRYTPDNPNSVTMTPGPGGSGPVTINNVAPGLVAPGSVQAVNGGQLYAMGQQTLTMANQYTDQRVQQVRNYARSGVALGVAMAQLHYNAVQAGDISVSASAGMFDGAAATAAGIRMQINDRISVGGQVSFDPSSGYFAGGISGSIRFH